MKEIALANGGIALVDDRDYDLVAPYQWRFHQGYARCSVRVGGRWKTLQMHTLILPLPTGMQVDHANRNGLDNQRSNLRPATRSQQRTNTIKFRAWKDRPCTSKYKGVRRHREGKWEARIRKHGVSHYLGLFPTEADAHAAYITAAMILHGEFARIA